MRRLLTGYAVAYNRRHRRWGHLFENRYPVKKVSKSRTANVIFFFNNAKVINLKQI
jgi:hypothetical protein